MKELLLWLSRRLRFKGKYRLLNLLGGGLNNPDIVPSHCREITCLGGLVVTTNNPRDLMFRELYINGFYQDDVLVALLNLLGPGGVFWDVGANYGYMSTFVSRYCGPDVTIHCFEPNPPVADVLEANVRRNACPAVHIHRIGVTDQPGQINLYAAPDNSWNATVMSEFAGSVEEKNSYTVPCSTLDELSQRLPLPDTIKIDVEGAERLVLAGGQALFKSHRPSLIIEFNRKALTMTGIAPSQFIEDLHRFGYTIFQLRRPLCGFYRWDRREVVNSADDLSVFSNLICVDATRAAQLPHGAKRLVLN